MLNLNVLAPHLPHLFHPNPITPTTNFYYPSQFSEAPLFYNSPQYNVSPLLVDPRGQRPSSSLQFITERSSYEMRLPIALISFNPMYITRDAIINYFGSRKLRDTLNNRVTFGSPSGIATRKPLLTPTDTYKRRHDLTSFTNSFNYDQLLPTSLYIQTNGDSMTYNTGLQGAGSQLRSSSTPLLLSDLHDDSHTSLDLLAKHDDVRSSAGTDACRYVSCQKLAVLCAGRRQSLLRNKVNGSCVQTSNVRFIGIVLP